MFARLLVLDQRRAPRGGAENMARDEALVDFAAGHTAAAPVLRLYRWGAPALSFGCFLRYEDAEAAAREGDELIRRWTGGGMVRHGEDFAWTLAVPVAHAFVRTPPAESYVRLHTALAEALARCGVEGVSVVPSDTPAPAAGMCFIAPAPGDLLWRGQKIAGAGQRRTRRGLLHQGSLQGNGLVIPENLGDALAGVLSPVVEALPADAAPPPPGPWRYDDPVWLRRR